MDVPSASLRPGSAGVGGLVVLWPPDRAGSSSRP
jgi:hypothetical protein